MDFNGEERLVVNRLRDHVFGESGPTEMLLNDGQLPDGWASEYRDLLQIAAKQWQHQPMWPRELVAAVHFASWYLHLRYDVWCATNGRNENTERELASLRSPSELFLMHGSLDIDTDSH
jgi:hypothetical protein